ncbi:MAG TPA: UDP-N-acetylmuramate dehydrogenase [Syntrophorhabdaceae bacterium]|nr:UDP-N-acetylmuramate dehydrogenase [Syntrophorhabdaceae bacterium]HPU30324.1 UDP-N-acetylmuramate dehydrogenase [Syntrophorhabdaceae bacterium]
MDWKGIRGEVLQNVSMKRYTSMKVGGNVKYMIYPVDNEDLIDIVARLNTQEIKYRFLGNGTNIIVNDGILDEAIIRITKIKMLRKKEENGLYKVKVSGGTSLKHLIRYCAEHGLSGLERLYWIPGTVGGGLKMNASSFGATISDCLEYVELLKNNYGVKEVQKNEMFFGYRTSSIGKCDCVVSAQFVLKKRDKKEILKDMEYVFNERKKRHPMEYPSSGSIFKSVNNEPAWKFIEKANLKGLRIGGACISEKHGNFIVNMGDARARDIKALIEKIKKEVFELFGVELVEEVELWGFEEERESI